MNKDLSRVLNKKLKEKFPGLDLTPEQMCHVTIMTLSALVGFLRKRTRFNGSRLLRYARDSVKSLVASD